MSWGDVDKKQGSGNAGRFVQVPESGTVRLRVLDEEPYTTRVHKISQMVRKGDKVEEVFRSIPATENPDDNFILKNNPKRYPEQSLHNLRVAEFKKDKDGKDTDEFEYKILQGGPAIFKPLRELFTQHGHLNQFDITISKKGKGRETEYTVSAAPFSKNINVVEATQKLFADVSWSWENIFLPVTSADQQKAIQEAGFDIAYDPAAQIAANMTLEQAQNVKFTMGKYGQKGSEKTVGEVMIIDAGYLQWAADNITSNDQLAAACRVMLGKVAQVSQRTEPVKQQLPPQVPQSAPAPSAPAQPTPAPQPAATSNEKSQLIEQVSDHFEQNPKFEDMSLVVGLVQKHSGGKSKLKDLTEAQLKNLLAEIENG